MQDLLRNVYVKISQILSLDVSTRIIANLQRILTPRLQNDVPNTPTALREKLSLRLKQLVQLTGDYEKKIRGVEIKLEYGVAYVPVSPLRWPILISHFTSNLNRELDSKKRLLDNVENSVSKMAAAKQEWRAKLIAKEEELVQAKASYIYACAHTLSLIILLEGPTARNRRGVGILQGFQHCRILERTPFVAGQGIIRG